MEMNATLTRMIRLVRRSLRSDQRVTVSQKKKSPADEAQDAEHILARRSSYVLGGATSRNRSVCRAGGST